MTATTPAERAIELRRQLEDANYRYHVLDEPSDFALETLAVISERSGAQPSAIVRYAATSWGGSASRASSWSRSGRHPGSSSRQARRHARDRARA